MLASGNLPAVQATLAAHGTASLALDSSLTNLEGQIARAFQTVAPRTALVARGEGTLRGLMRERGELPLERRVVPTGQTDLFGQPTYTLRDVNLPSDWVGRGAKFAGASALVILEPAFLDVATWRNFQPTATQTCAESLQWLDARAQGEAAEVAPFLRYADAAFAPTFHAHLQLALPSIRARLAAVDASDGPTQACVESYRNALAPWEACAQDQPTCEVALRGALANGFVVGVMRPDVHVADHCKERVGFDIEALLLARAQAVAQTVTAVMPPAWLARAEQASLWTSLHSAVEASCAPMRGRLQANTVDALRDDLLTTAATLGTLAVEDGTFVPASGAIQAQAAGGQATLQHVLTRQSATAQSLRQTLAAWSRNVQAARTCNSYGAWQPLQVTVIDVATSKVEGVYWLLAEELMCSVAP